ncbi:MAG: hypothetical protein GTN80_01990 [Nitrososphaeria archaeon]|nr:hypothetical protein [Nitrososphaeria archaeon]
MIGHISTITPKGVLVHPIAYYCDGEGIVFGTPRGSAKLKWLKENPKVSFTVDNGELMKESMGVTVQGEAEIYGFRSIAKSLRSALRSTYGYLRKYPEGLKYYLTKGGELPDDRKFYKYVFVRIHPSRIVYWDGYKFGRITSKAKKEVEDPQIPPEEDPVVFAKYVKDYYDSLESIDSELKEEIPAEQLGGSLFADELYLNALKEKTMDVTTLLSLPDSLRKTGVAVLKLKRGTLDEIAAETGRTKQEEKRFLNRLTLMRLLKKKREDGQMIYCAG